MSRKYVKLFFAFENDICFLIFQIKKMKRTFSKI